MSSRFGLANDIDEVCAAVHGGWTCNRVRRKCPNAALSTPEIFPDLNKTKPKMGGKKGGFNVEQDCRLAAQPS
jgi:hypothetical protein